MKKPKSGNPMSEIIELLGIGNKYRLMKDFKLAHGTIHNLDNWKAGYGLTVLCVIALCALRETSIQGRKKALRNIETLLNELAE